MANHVDLTKAGGPIFSAYKVEEFPGRIFVAYEQEVGCSYYTKVVIIEEKNAAEVQEENLNALKMELRSAREKGDAGK
jgi:hypothetical protein